MTAATGLKPTALGLAPSFGFGDRLGNATAGHLDALRKAGGAIKGIFAQQSIREMSRTNRTAQQVMEAAVQALQAAKFNDVWGADADHLKTEADVIYTADAGFVFYTIDPSGFVDQHADDYDQQSLAAKFAAISDQVDWVREYQDKTITVKNGPAIQFSESTVARAAVKYGRAIAQTIQLGKFIEKTAGERKQEFEIELSVDETEQPTSLAEHYIIADQCRRGGLKLISLAPRFIGDFEKGVDYKGDLAALEKSLQDHAAIARELGPYKLSLHSGSDKVSIYNLFARSTDGLFHVKTAGTSYLEALRVVAIHAPDIFREIIQFSRARYNTDKATYHVSATLENTPELHTLTDAKAIQREYLECWEDVPEGKGFTKPGRQVLHCTFGSVLTDKKFGPLVHQILKEHSDTYQQVLSEHFQRHLQPLVI
jgi:hypothetical protein